MSYPGNAGLSVQAQERVMTAFKQVLKNLQAGQREEALIGLEFVLRLDPTFAPANALKRQLASSPDEIDLGDIIAQLQAPTTDAINGLLIEAVDDFNSREFLTARQKVEKVLIDLPGHQEARDLRDQIDKALKIESQVGQFLMQAREALAAGDPQEAANFVMMAQALDPHHTGIATTLKEIDQTGGLALSQETGEPAPPTQQPSAPPFEDQSAPPPQAEPETPPAAPTGPPDDDDGDAFAVEFDTNDPFADLIEPDASGETGGGPAFEFGAGDEVAFPPMDDTSDLFDAPAQTPDSGGPDHERDGATDDQAAAPQPEDAATVAETIQDHIERGQAALAAGDQALAISIWSRIFLIKPAHPEAGHLIEKAKRSLAEAEAEAERLLTDARDAFDAGELDAAQLLVTKALGRRPNHIGATILNEELARERGRPEGRPAPRETTTAAADAHQAPASLSSPELPELDDDLFDDGAVAADAEPAAAKRDEIPVGADDDLFDEELADFDDFDDLSLLGRLRSRLPMRIVGLAAAALVIVLVGVWLGGRMLSSEPEVDDAAAVSEVLIAADRLFKEHKVDEAIHLLREFPASGLSQQRIDMRIAKYEESLAPPTPTPIPEDTTRAEALLDQGLWWAAYAAAGDGLKAHPDDSGLADLRRQIADNEPEAPLLETALATRNYRTAVSIAEEALQQYPGQGDLQVVLERSLFNAALAEARAYNLTGAENHLLRLLELKPGDEEAVRFLEFVQKYKVRAADMRLEIFIRSMNER